MTSVEENALKILPKLNTQIGIPEIGLQKYSLFVALLLIVEI